MLHLYSRCYLRILYVVPGPERFGAHTKWGANVAESGGLSDLTRRSFLRFIGLILPRDSQVARDLAAGLKVGLGSSTAAPVELLASTSAGGPFSIERVARQLIAERQAGAVVGLSDTHVAAHLHPLLAEHGTHFVAATTGANVVRAAEQSPFLHHVSLRYWQANWAMGRWAAKQMGRKAFVAASLYESGYDALAAFQAGFESAGGTVVETQITDQRVIWADLMAAIRSARPDLVFACYSGSKAVDFVKQCEKAGLTGLLPLAASAFAVDEARLPDMGESAEGIVSCFSWAPSLKTQANKAFAIAYEAVTGCSPNAYALLGYNTAAAIGGPTAPEGDEPLYVRVVRSKAHEILTQVNAVSERDNKLKPLRTAVRTGWMHSYRGI